MRRTALDVLRAAVLVCPLALLGADISPQAYLDDVKYLASVPLKGRATGSPELEKAASHIASDFQSFGLKPVDGKNFELSFPATLTPLLGQNNTLSFKDGAVSETLKEGRDFVPFSFSATGKFSGPVVFAGYGITAREYNYDDYAGLDVEGKIVLLLRHEPQEFDEHSVFAGKRLTSHATFADKAVNAKMHGARGVILINDVPSHSGNEDKLEKFGQEGGPHNAGVFFIQMKAATAEKWLAAEGHDLRQASAEIDKDLKPQSFALSKVNVDVNVDLVQQVKTVHNVAGYLPGNSTEYIIIGAHYDHLGLGDEHSLAPNQLGTIHPGADDNASGTAGVIELARYFGKDWNPAQHRRGILFMTFAGEELGLLGSEWYTEHPILPLENCAAMINMDMIGRIREGRVFLSGVPTGSTFSKLVDDVKFPAPLHLDFAGKNSGTNMDDASDHASFAAKHIPTLFFFSGLHGDYHKPSDTWDKINSVDAAKLLDGVSEMAEHLADAAERPQYVRVVRPAAPVTGSNSSNSGYGPYFGSIPDFNEPPKGVRFADVRAGSPADQAGLKPGDIMIEFDGKEIANLYDFTYALRNHNPGDLVPVKVLRGTATIEAKVLLTSRR